MRKSKYALVALALSASVAGVSAARAAVSVEVWGGSDGTNNYTSNINNHTDDDASGPPPTGTDTAKFTWSAPIDWTDNTGNNGGNAAENTFAEFLLTNGGTLADISGFSSGVGLTEANFLTLSMSTAGSSDYSYFWITGTSGAGTASISHDDGASVYQFGPAIYSSPAETSDITQSFAIGAGAYQVAYIEANGSPSDLTLVTPGVPEVSTWAMMLAGFAGVGFVGFARTRRTHIAIA